MQPDSHISELLDFALDKIGGEPVPKRIRLYVSLSEIIGDEKEAVRLRVLADDLAAIERRHQQLVLDFRQGRRARQGGRL